MNPKMKHLCYVGNLAVNVLFCFSLKCYQRVFISDGRAQEDSRPSSRRETKNTAERLKINVRKNMKFENTKDFHERDLSCMKNAVNVK